MKISELIQELEKIQSEHGDLVVLVLENANYGADYCAIKVVRTDSEYVSLSTN